MNKCLKCFSYRFYLAAVHVHQHANVHLVEVASLSNQVLLSRVDRSNAGLSGVNIESAVVAVVHHTLIVVPIRSGVIGFALFVQLVIAPSG